MANCAPLMKASKAAAPDRCRFIAGRDTAVVTISLKQANAGTWAIRRCQINLFSDLTLGAAISLARELARDEHQRSSCAVSVEMPVATSAIVLAHYTNGDVAAAIAA
jgi:hypothetical protein